MKKLIVAILTVIMLSTGNAWATWKTSAINLAVTPNSDAYAIGGETTPRTLTLTAADWTFNATQMIAGANTYGLPGASDTLAGIAASQAFTNKTITSSTDTLGGVTMGLGSDAVGDMYIGGSSNVLTRVADVATGSYWASGGVATAPGWQTLNATAVGLSAVTNNKQIPGLSGGTTSGHLVTWGADGYTVADGGAVPSGIIPWTDVTSGTQALAINNGYIADYATLVTATLPSTAAVGSIVAVVGKGAGGWKIAQNASQYINFGSQVTTTGTGGYLASNNAFDSVEVVCVTANNGWVVRSSQGNISGN